MGELCISVVNDVIEKTKIRMLEREVVASVKERCGFSFEGIIVKKNCFHIYDPSNHALLYSSNNMHSPNVHLIFVGKEVDELSSLG